MEEAPQSRLTEAQLGLWLGHQRAGDPSVFHAAQLVLFQGDFVAEALERALRKTLREARTLHIAFREEQGRPVIVPLGLHAPAHQKSAVERSKIRSEALSEWLDQKVRQPLSLEEGELCRHVVFETDDERWGWLHVAHHIALDGYGFNLIARRVSENYRDEIGSSPALPAWFSDLAEVQAADARYEASPQREKDARFLREQFGYEPKASFCVPQPAARPLRQARKLPPSVVRRLEARLSCEKLSMADLAAAVAARSAARAARSSKFRLGFPVMLRLGTPALKAPITAMNILPIPVQVEEGVPLSALARQLQATVRAALPHQRFRYEHLEQIDEGLTFGPVVNVMPFDFPLDFGNCQTEFIDVAAGPVRDLSVSLITRSGTWQLGVDGHPHLYREPDLEELLDEMTSELQAWADGQDAHPLVQCAVTAVTTPESPCLVEASGRIWTARHLATAVDACAKRLAEHVTPGDRVALDLERSPLSVVLPLACFRVGTAYVALDEHHPPARRAQIISKSAPSLVVSNRRKGAEFPGVPHLYLDANDVRDQSELAPLPPLRWGPPDPSSLAYLIFTSGSTGEPKGIEIEHQALAHFSTAAKRAYEFRAADRVLQFASLCFDASVEEIFVAISARATLVLRDSGPLPAPADFWPMCAEQRLSVLDLPTAYFHALLADARSLPIEPWLELRLVIVGGEVLSAARALSFKQWAPAVRLLNTYGPSETTVVVTYHEVTADSVYGGDVPIGLPLFGVGAHVVNEEGEPVAPFVEGELAITGPTLARGYLRDETQTRARFRPLANGERAYRTGDRARCNFRGELLFGGRFDEELKISGVRISPREVEAALSQHHQVSAAVVAGLPGKSGKIILAAAVEWAEEPPGAGAPEESARKTLIECAARSLPPTMIPSVVHFSSSLPRTVANKLDRQAIVRLLQEDHVTPSSDVTLPEEEDTAAKLRRAWEEVLGVRNPGWDEDFFALGGSSIQVIDLAAALAENGLRLSAGQLFSSPTLRAQLNTLQEATPPQSPPPFAPAILPPLVAGPASRASGPILLTGATGFVGAYLLHELLRNDAGPVLCLVRGENDEEAGRRLRARMKEWGVPLRDMEPKLQVRALGESATEQLSRLGPCRFVLHAAAEVSLVRDYSSLLASNVTLTYALLQRALDWGARFVHVSTLATVPPDVLGTEDEEAFFPFHSALQDGYQRSKAHAEQLCQEASSLGIDVRVVRLGRIVGARRHPTINPQDLVWRIASSAARLGAFPDLPVEEPWTPVDETARELITLCQLDEQEPHRRHEHRVVHLSAPETVAFSRVHDALVRAGYSLPQEPTRAWIARLKESSHPQDQALAAFFVGREATPHAARAPRAGAIDQLLGGRRFVRPIDDTLLDDFVDAARRANVL